MARIECGEDFLIVAVRKVSLVKESKEWFNCCEYSALEVVHCSVDV